MRTIQIRVTDIEKDKQFVAESTIFNLNEVAKQTNCDPLRLMITKAIQELDKECGVITPAIESHLMF